MATVATPKGSLAASSNASLRPFRPLLKSHSTNPSIVLRTTGREQKPGSIVKHGPTSTLHVLLEQSATSRGWPNDLEDLEVGYLLNASGLEDMTAPLRSESALPNPIPVVTDTIEGFFIIHGSDGKYYFWHNPSDKLAEPYERTLANILSTFKRPASLEEPSTGYPA